jgi:hypothetical protein
MKLIAHNTIYAGGERIAPGTAFDINDDDGRVLLARNFASEAPPEAVPEKTVEPVATGKKAKAS